MRSHAGAWERDGCAQSALARPRAARYYAQRPISLSFGEPGPILSERASRDVLAAYDIPLVPAAFVRTEAEAVDAAERLGFPVVMKVNAPGLPHRAAAGLVRTGIPSAREVRTAYRQLKERSSIFGDQPSVLIAVEATATGIELLCGMRRDPLFGPVVLIGVGGTLTEAYRDVAVRVCPVAEEDLEELMDECSAGRLVAAARCDPAPVMAVVAALSRLALDHGEIEEIDVNPLFVGTHGVSAADALVVLSGAEGSDT